MSGGEEWQKQVRRARAAQRAAQRRGSGRGRGQADRPGMIRLAPSIRQPDRQPTGHAASPARETTTMPDHKDQAPAPADAEPGLLLRELVDGTTRNPPESWAEAVRTTDVKPALDQHIPSPWELAARIFEQPPGGDQ